MNAVQLLINVAAAYNNLKTLAVEFLITNEDDEGRNERRSRGFFAAPDKVRFEQGGRRGMTLVADGSNLHNYFAVARRYMRLDQPARDLLPGFFRPEFPYPSSPVFFFGGIAEHIVFAEILREEAGEHVVIVEYAPGPHPHFMTGSPVTFWIDSSTYLVMRMEGHVTRHQPSENEPRTSKAGLVFQRISVDDPIPESTFIFDPPEGAIDATDPSGRGGGFAGGVGGGYRSLDSQGRAFAHWCSREWIGDTLVLKTKLKLHEIDLAFERRLVLSENRKQMRVVEQVSGPLGQTEHEFAIPIE